VIDARLPCYMLANEMSSFWNLIKDLTIPLVAYFSGRSLNEVMIRAFRDARIEDMVNTLVNYVAPAFECVTHGRPLSPTCTPFLEQRAIWDCVEGGDCSRLVSIGLGHLA
jgi:hypothetical protein